MLDHTWLHAGSLASILEQSTDCVKLIGLDGTLIWMNANGLCAMEIEDFGQVCGQPWASFWNAAGQAAIAAALEEARAGTTSRFRAPCPTAKGSPRWWEVSVTCVSGPDGAAAGYLATSRDVTQGEADREALRVLLAEMRHRLKNSYALIGGLMLRLAKGNSEHEAFAGEMMKRLNALAASQSLFEAEGALVRLAALIGALADPFENAAETTVSVAVPDDIWIGRRNADAVAIVLGELVVNSAKYGAIGKGGSIALQGRQVDGTLTLAWSERTAAPRLASSRVGGQGLDLIERIARARSGTLSLDWQDHGVDATLTLPADG